jgi:hypothetical protein
VLELPIDACPALAAHLEKYADLDLDLANAELIWLAELVGEFQVLTVDQPDFGPFRMKGRKRFDLAISVVRLIDSNPHQEVRGKQ